MKIIKSKYLISKCFILGLALSLFGLHSCGAAKYGAPVDDNIFIQKQIENDSVLIQGEMKKTSNIEPNVNKLN